MAGSLNKVMLIGNVGRDPEMRYIQSGEAVTTFSVATNRRFKGQDGQYQDDTEWHNIVAWGKLAEQCNEYLAKGRKVYIEGRLQTRSWDDQQSGQKKYRTEIVANTMLMLDQRPRDGMDGNGETDAFSGERFGGDRPERSERAGRGERRERALAPVGGDENTIDLDDTPF
ncbi:MAG TPA: single-stranded DNA-binding protein [Chloroflexota bacterium]|nr:single-stranded DNA-binding protein [Chloroflexota bacterium]